MSKITKEYLKSIRFNEICGGIIQLHQVTYDPGRLLKLFSWSKSNDGDAYWRAESYNVALSTEALQTVREMFRVYNEPDDFKEVDVHEAHKIMLAGEIVLRKRSAQLYRITPEGHLQSKLDGQWIDVSADYMFMTKSMYEVQVIKTYTYSEAIALMAQGEVMQFSPGGRGYKMIDNHLHFCIGKTWKPSTKTQHKLAAMKFTKEQGEAQ